MGRYIDADEFKTRIDRYPPDIRDTAKKELKHCKTVDVIPIRRGYWEEVDMTGYLSPGGTPTVRCSVCKDKRTYHLSGVEFNEWRRFCAFCGAVMHEVVE